MDEFLRQFKNNLENQPAPEFDGEDWDDMQQRLEQQHQGSSKPVNYWAWATAVLLFMFLGSNGLVLQKLNQANQKISYLESSIDTLVQTQVIFRTDTIYQFVDGQTIHESSSRANPKNETITTRTKNNTPQQENLTDLSTLNQLNLTPIIHFTNHAQQRSPLTLFSENTLSGTVGLQNTLSRSRNNIALEQQGALAKKSMRVAKKQEGHTTAHSLLNPIKLSTSSFISTNHRPLPSSLNRSPISSIKRKKSIRQVLYPMRPKGIELGISYGLGMSLAEHHRDQKIRQWELIAQVKFSQSIRLWIAGHFKSLDYESTQMGAQYGVPELAAPKDNFEFDEANIEQRIISISTGLQYHFRASKKWQPFIGIGYGLSTLTHNSMRYRFEEAGMPNFNTSELVTVVYENANNLPFALFKSGINYQLNNRFSFQLSGEYLYRINDHNNQIPNILTGKLGASFSF